MSEFGTAFALIWRILPPPPPDPPRPPAEPDRLGSPVRRPVRPPRGSGSASLALPIALAA